MTILEFKPWPKTPRLNRDMVITEKIDGTNGCVVIKKIDSETPVSGLIVISGGDGIYAVGAQSRNRRLPVGPQSMDDVDWQKRDNAGFGAWVYENAAGLVQVLGEGYHYGEWYGAKIGRKYGLSERRFALFNVGRYGDLDLSPVPNLETVPVLYTGPFDTYNAMAVYGELMETGSRAVPGFMQPEGIIVYHTASKQVYKVTDRGDLPKWRLQAVAA